MKYKGIQLFQMNKLYGILFRIKAWMQKVNLCNIFMEMNPTIFIGFF